MVKLEVNASEVVSKPTDTLLTVPRKRGRPQKLYRRGVHTSRRASSEKSSRFPLPGKCLRPRTNARDSRSDSCVNTDLDSSSMALCSTPNCDELPHNNCDLVDVRELWDYYSTRAEYQTILSTSLSKSSKKYGKYPNRQNVIEKISELKRIEQCITKGIKQITTFEFFNYVNPLCPGFNDVITDVYIVSCGADKVIQKDFLSSAVVPCRSTNHQKSTVLYYTVPPNVEKYAVNVYLVVKVYIEQRYHYIGSARKIRRSRGEKEPADVNGSPVLKRILYGVRKVAIGSKEGVSPLFGNHTVALINSETDNVDGYQLDLTDEGWMLNCGQLAEFAKIGKKLCSSGPIGLINFGISDEHVEYDWGMVKKTMDARLKRKTEQQKASDIAVWYYCREAFFDDEIQRVTRGSPSSDKENRTARYTPCRTPRSPQKLLVTTNVPKCSRVAIASDYTLPTGALDRVYGLVCPFTGKVFHDCEELEEYLRFSYPAFEFEKLACTSTIIRFAVLSKISRTQWHKARLQFVCHEGIPVEAVSPQRKPRYAPPEELPTRKESDLPKAQIIPFGEMSFVHPTYSQVPGPSSSKVYHSVVEDTCDWKIHLMERNIRDYIDDTPQEKEFMLLHNRFRSKFRHLIVGEKLTLDFYTKFVECCGMEMKKKRIRAHCVARLTRLVQQDKMTPTNMATLTQKLYELGPNDPE